MAVTLLFPFTLAAGLSPIWHFSGVFHPAVVHFPIALLTFAGIVEAYMLLKKRRAIPGRLILACLWIGAIGSTVASLLGWASAASVDSFSDVLRPIVELHRWLGVAISVVSVAVAITATAAMRRRSPALLYIYRSGAIFAAGLVGLVGMYGGQISYGPNHYRNAFTTMLAKLSDGPATASASTAQPPSTQTVRVNSLFMTTPESIAEPVEFEKDIKPLFDASCVDCHGKEKQKGDYRLDEKQPAFIPGESGERPIIPGDSDESLLVKLLEGEGEYAESKMPVKGPPLTRNQIALIRRWIDQGAN